MKLKFDDNEKGWKDFAIAGSICVFLYVFLSHLGLVFGFLGKFLNLFQPIFLGAIIAYIVLPLVKIVDKWFRNLIKKDSIRWSIASILSIVLVLAIVIIFLMAVIPQLVDNILSLLNNLSDYILNIENTIDKLNPEFRDIIRQAYETVAVGSSVLDTLTGVLTDNLSSIVSSISSFGSATVGILVAVIIAIYILTSKEGICDFFRKLAILVLKPMNYSQVTHFLGKFNTIFSKYIICEILDSLIVGGANYIFMGIMHMPDAFLISIVVGLTNLAPTFGPVIGAVIGTFILLLVKPDAILAFLIFTVVIQTIDGYVIKPKFFGGALNVPGVLILFAIIVFGRLLGITGMLIAIPAAAIICYLYTEIFIPWLQLKKDLNAYKKEQSKMDK